MQTIVTVKIHPMCEAVLSILVLRYQEDNNESLFEEYGTVADLCAKYQISSQHNFYDSRHLIGRRCRIEGENERRIFKGYS